MDPVSIIGLAGSIVNIVDVIAKTIKTLRDLQQRWKAADWTTKSLISQLSTVRTALNQIQQWMASNHKGKIPDDQLVLELGESLDCCRTLVTFMNEQLLLYLKWTESNDLTSMSKMKTILHDGEVKECATHLHRQSSALTLLLTALNCKSLSQQTDLLQAQESKRTLHQVKDDSSSLRGLRARSSFHSSRTASSYTERSALVSIVFDFDDEILDSSAYQRQMRSLIRPTRSKANTAVRSAVSTRKQFTCFDSKDYLDDYFDEHFSGFHFSNNALRLHQAQIVARQSCTISIFCDNDKKFATLMKRLRSITSSGRTYRERVQWRNIIRWDLILSMQYLLEMCKFIGREHPSPQFTDYATSILSLKDIIKPEDVPWDAYIVNCLEKLWSQVNLAEIDAWFEAGTFPHWNDHKIVLHLIDRIVKPDYIPEGQDINGCCPPTSANNDVTIIQGAVIIKFEKGGDNHNVEDNPSAFIRHALILMPVVNVSCNPSRFHPSRFPGADLDEFNSKHTGQIVRRPRVGGHRDDMDGFTRSLCALLPNKERWKIAMILDLNSVSSSHGAACYERGCPQNDCFSHGLRRFDSIGGNREVRKHLTRQIDDTSVSNFILEYAIDSLATKEDLVNEPEMGSLPETSEDQPVSQAFQLQQYKYF